MQLTRLCERAQRHRQRLAGPALDTMIQAEEAGRRLKRSRGLALRDAQQVAQQLAEAVQELCQLLVGSARQA